MPQHVRKEDDGESKMSIPYDLLDVAWGEEILRARPIAWNQDLTAEDVDPEEIEDVLVTSYELVCPNCGGRCEFTVADQTINCEDCGSSTDNPAWDGSKNIENEDIPLNPTEGPPEDIPDDIVEDIEKAKETLKDPAKSPENILDSLTESIQNTEITLEEPDEEDKKAVEEIKKSAKKKIKKKSQKKKKSKKKT